MQLKRTPLVSVLMTNYNRESTVKESVESVLNQTYRHLRMIVIDDGSDDRSMEILEEIRSRDDRLEIWHLDQNVHICRATNFGFSKVTGEYLARIDSDDVWYPEKLEKQLSFLQNNPEYRICFSWIDLIDEYGCNINKDQEPLLKMFEKSFRGQTDCLRYFFFEGNCLSHPSVLMETSLMREIGGFTTGYMQSHDFDYWVRIAKKYPLYVCEERLLAMRRFVHLEGGDNNSNSEEINGVRFYNEFAHMKEHFFDDMDNQLFIDTFRPYFRCADSASDLELECEKAFLLLWESTQKHGVRPAGVDRFFRLFEQEKAASLLQEKYHFTLQDLYRVTGNHVYYDRWMEDLDNESKALRQRSLELENEIRMLQEENARLSQLNLEYSESTSWKVTRPLRNTKAALRGIKNPRRNSDKPEEDPEPVKTFSDVPFYHHTDRVIWQSRTREIHVYGWVIRGEKGDDPIDFIIRDDKGQTLPVQVQFQIRSDVNNTWNLDAFCKSGFHLSFPAQKTRTAALYFYKYNTEYKFAEILISDIKKEQGRLHRLSEMVQISRWNEHKENFRLYGFQKLAKEYASILDGETGGYALWEKQHRTSEKALKKQRHRHWEYAPLISILTPLYETGEDFLTQLIDSCIRQSYPNWELCLADGSSDNHLGQFIVRRYGSEHRIRYRHLHTNEGISGNTNQALAMAEGEYILFCDHDDFLAPDALYELAKVWNMTNPPDLIYTDEDKVSADGLSFSEPAFKSAFNRELLMGQNYINHIFSVRRSLALELGGLRPEYDGAQDFDFVLRCIEKAKRVYHIPKILYHWRNHPDSTAGDAASKTYAFESGKHAVEDYYRRNGIEAQVSMTAYAGIYRTRYCMSEQPQVSIILEEAFSAQRQTEILETVTYPYVEICFAGNSAEHPGEYRECIRSAKGEYLLFLCACAKPDKSEWVEELLSCTLRDDVGITGGKSVSPDRMIESAGLIFGIGTKKLAGKAFHGFPETSFTYMGKVNFTQEVSAVTKNMLMIQKSLFEELGGFDADLQADLQTADLCLKVKKAGKRILMNAYAVAEVPFLSDSFELPASESESAYFKEKWNTVFTKGDFYYNPNLSIYTCDSDLKWTH